MLHHTSNAPKGRIYNIDIILQGVMYMYYFTLEEYLRRKTGMKMFVSWSGEKSKAIAELLRWWLPDICDDMEPWVSTEDIETGTVWFTKVCEEIRDVCNSIIIVTNENKEKPWIMFEAGALCKGDDTNRVNILLVDVDPNELKAPLSFFNAVSCDECGLRKLLRGLCRRINETKTNPKQQIPLDRIDRRFNKNYPDFKAKFDEIMAQYPVDAPVVKKSDEEHFQGEVLATLRRLEKMLWDTRRQTAINNADIFLKYLTERNGDTDGDERTKAAILEQMIKSYAMDRMKMEYT